MLDKQLAHSPQFLALARRLLGINEEKVALAVEFRDFHIDYQERLNELNSRIAKAVDEFNLLYGQAQLNATDS